MLLSLFNQHFSDFVGRQWLYAPDVSDAQIEQFLDFHNQVIVKPHDEGGGKGIYKTSRSEIADMKDFCGTARKERLILEEIVEQHPVLHTLNPASVNTIRINTVIDREGTPHVIVATLRIGQGQAVVDNLAAGGIVAHIDLHSGILCAAGMDKNGRSYIRHPDSGVVIPGLQIPLWDDVIKMVIRAAERAYQLQQFRWVGWDVAVTEKGPLLIEGNANPCPVVMQLSSQTGYYRIFRRYI